jgi:hypothetical protein
VDTKCGADIVGFENAACVIPILAEPVIKGQANGWGTHAVIRSKAKTVFLSRRTVAFLATIL